MVQTSRTIEPVEAARAAVARLSGLPEQSLAVEVDPAGGSDQFTVSTAAGRLQIRASSPVAAAAGYAAYAKQTAVGMVSRFGTRPASGVAELAAPITARSPYAYRVAYNFTVSGYTTPFFDWEQWERELDLIAASGINAAHVTVGQEVVWLETFTQFGYSEAEILAWIVPPSHQPWQWLNNLHSYGGGTTRGLIERRIELGRRVIARMRELGIRPVLPGFSGSVPQEFSTRNPGADVVPQGRWFMDFAGSIRPDWLATDTELYAKVADAFYAAQRNVFGEHGTWAVDLLHEGGKLGERAQLTDAARGVEAALRRADPNYLWVIQAWAGNPRPQLLDAIDKAHVLVLDLLGNDWQKAEAFRGVPWALGIVPNYGGRPTLYGDLNDIAQTPARAGVGRPECKALAGLTNMGEGVANNPVVWDLFCDLAWTDAPIDLTAWLDDWTTARYGAADPAAREAWTVLLQTAYATWRADGQQAMPAESTLAAAGTPVDAATVGEPPEDANAATSLVLGVDESAVNDLVEDFDAYAAADSVIAAVPSVYANQASVAGSRMLHYEVGALVPALRLLVNAASHLDTPGFRYDLVEVARQVLDDEARRLLPALAATVKGGDADEFDRLSELFLRVIDVQDALLSTSEDHLLGRWVADAERWAGSETERRQIAEYAKRLITIWGERDNAFLTDYTNRSWAGLVGDYYGSRWRLWLAEVRKALTGQQTTPVEWFEVGERWARQDQAFATEPTGDLRQAVDSVLDLVDEIAREVPDPVGA